VPVDNVIRRDVKTYFAGLCTEQLAALPLGNYTGFDTICGASSTVTYGAVSGEYIGADPMAFDQMRTVGCQVFIDRVFSYGDYARDGEHHDVNCLRTLSYDYYPNSVQERAL
jgi:hypothetical protein